jgi:hypothetical protein
MFWDFCILCYITPCSPLNVNRYSEEYLASEMSVDIQVTTCVISQKISLHERRCDNLKSYSSTLKMKATFSSETSVVFQGTTRRYIPEDRSFHNYRSENLISYYIYYADLYAVKWQNLKLPLLNTAIAQSV